MSQPLSALLAGGADTPQPDRAHRLLVAQRLAEAVDAVHAAGDVVGNLHDHRVLVAPDGAVRAMPRIGGPVTVGVGAMIPDTPAYADKLFVVTVQRVAMLADEE